MFSHCLIENPCAIYLKKIVNDSGWQGRGFFWKFKQPPRIVLSAFRAQVLSLSSISTSCIDIYRYCPCLIFSFQNGFFAQNYRNKVVDFHWNPVDPWTIVSVSNDVEKTGGGTLQVTRILCVSMI